MSITDILKRALYLYKKNFALLAGITLPGWILIIFSGSLLGKATLVKDQVTGSNISDEISIVDLIKTSIASISATSLIFFLLFFVAAVGVIAISKLMLNQKIKAGQSYKNAFNRIFPLLGSLVLTTGLIGFAFALPIVGIIFGSLCYVYFNLVSQVVMLEGEGGIGAMKRAKGLIREYFKKSAILMVPPLILQTVLMMLIYRGVELIHFSTLTIMVTALLTVAVGTLTEPFKILISTLLYYDLRIKKEGYDLELMAKEVTGEF